MDPTKPLSEMRTVTVSSLTEFIEKTAIFELLVNRTLFRGQTRWGNLLPSIARDKPSYDTTEEERMMLRQLERMGVTRWVVPPRDDWVLLVAAQHYGMKTRLLDWTTNPLAAMWFACSSPKEGPVYVYALMADDHMLRSINDADPFEVDETKVVEPRLGNARIVAQHGMFTVHRYSEGSRAFVPLELNHKTRSSLTEFIIPRKNCEQMVADLDRCGINQSTLFPDLEGLCKYLNWRHKTLAFHVPKK